jgi:hypothetical protein
MDQCCGLQCVAAPLPPQVTGGELMEFPIDEGRELAEGILIALGPSCEEACHIVAETHKSLRVRDIFERSESIHRVVVPQSRAKSSHTRKCAEG